MAFVNTDIAASFAAISWLSLEWTLVKKPKFVGLLTGAVAGLATITPAAGFVPPWAAAIIGLLAGVICYAAVSLKKKLQWDDALDVWGVHGVGGALGIVMLGLFATTTVNAAGANGLFFGGADFFFKEVVGVVVSSAYAFIFTYVMLWLINKVSTVKTTEVEETTLDESLHGESAYIN
jgi:Amt family ammonium transporter